MVFCKLSIAKIASIFLLLGLITSLTAQADEAADQVWQDSVRPMGITPADSTLKHYRSLTLSRSHLLAILAQLSTNARKQSSLIFNLPLPNGGFERFLIEPSEVMAPELAAQFPEIIAFKGTGVDNPQAWARFDWGPLGFHGYAHIDGQVIYVNPQDFATDRYISIYRSDVDRPAPGAEQEHYTDVISYDFSKKLEHSITSRANTSGTQLRTYRTAIATTGEYSQFYGGTASATLAAVVTTINRVSGIYETELSVRLQLVANNNLIIYTNPTTDPFAGNNSAGVLIGESQTVIDSQIGSANYDVGHTFSTGAGGLAGLGVVCGSYKASGVTGSSSPVGDAYDVDYVAHEFGHQFGANHTFNGTTGACAGNINASTAYEPGSGTTIMAYAGICSSQDIQPHSDIVMHSASFNEITSYLSTATGSSCGTLTSLSNATPSANAGTGGFSIPISTPFTLTGSGSDADAGDTLTYMWEEWDLGPAGAPNSPSGTAPLFRSFTPVSSPSRTFPQWSDILNNTHTLGELLPSYARAMNFRLTVRDGKGGVSSSDLGFNVVSSAGPFLVTAPNTSGQTINAGGYTVTWDVANTNTAPVNCSAVDILLSTDGGTTFDQTLLSATTNDGTANVTLPNNNVSNARIMVRCSNNVFFDVSDYNFAITATSPLSADLSITKTDGVTTVTAGTATTYTITASNAGPSAVTGATVSDTFPAACSSVSWSCTGAGGGTCAASGTGNINDGAVNLPVGASVTYSASCSTNAAATGTLSNTATVSSSTTDPTPGNNSATDTDTLAAPPSADLSITKTDGVTTVTAGTATTYTITASNAGPSAVTGATVSDTFPAACSSVSWSCTGAGGGTCAASGTGNINDGAVNLPVGASVTYSASCSTNAAATGTLSNTATVSSSTTDPTPGNNSATDTDTLASSAGIPTLSQWALILLATGLIGLGIRLQRRY